MKRAGKYVVLASSCAGLGYYFGKQSATTGAPSTLKVQNAKGCLNVLQSTDCFAPSTLKAATVTPINPDSAVVTVQQPASANTVQTIVKYGFPSMDNLRSYQDFLLSYDRRTRVPSWVLEHLTPEKVNIKEGAERSKMKFVEDQSVHEFHRATNKDYQGSGYDRGHMAAAANHRQSELAMQQTFTLSNIAPQVGEGFNRDAWNNLEKFVRALARKNRNVYVCTGPLFLPQYEPDGKLYVKYPVIGRNHIAVPTHFFKVVVIENNAGQLDLLSYVMPNQPLPSEVKLHHYLVPLDMIERAAGLNFFPNVSKGTFKRINAPPPAKS